MRRTRRCWRNRKERLQKRRHRRLFLFKLSCRQQELSTDRKPCPLQPPFIGHIKFSQQSLPQHLHLTFMPLILIILIISNSHYKDASCILRVFPKLSFKAQPIPSFFDLPDSFVSLYTFPRDGSRYTTSANLSISSLLGIETYPSL